MPTYVTLRINDAAEAKRLVKDMREHPGDPILTPVLENDVHATVVDVDEKP